MKEQVHSVLYQKANRLRDMLALYSTETILGHCAWFMYMDRYAVYEMVGLKGAHAQCLWALSLTMNTPQPAAPRRLDQRSWSAICRLLSDVFDCYWENFQVGASDAEDELTPDQRNAVAGYFMHHFGAPRVTSIELLRQRVTDTLSPFDSATRAIAGLSASDAVRIADWIIARTQTDVDQYNEALRSNKVGLKPELAWRDRPDWLLDQSWHQTLSDSHYTESPIPKERVAQLFTISHEQMAREFGEAITQAFCRTFVSVRGSSSEFLYPSDTHTAQRRPVFRLDEHRLFHPPGRFIYNAILDNFTDLLMHGDIREGFLTRRDKVLEAQTAECLGRFFGEEAAVIPSVFEPDGQHEHDLVVFWKDKMLVVEAKASPPAEHFRDPARAWKRLSRCFHSDCGIQKAFDQGQRLIRLASLPQPLRLFDHKRSLLREIPMATITESFAVCVTADDHGPIATDLSILLKRNSGDHYPWAVSILELQTILGGFAHAGIGPERFLQFLRERRQLHGRVLPYDESETAGIFMRYGTLRDAMPAEGDGLVVLLPKDGDVFDQIYREKRGGPKATTKANARYRLTLFTGVSECC